jgi:hypothetical protein
VSILSRLPSSNILTGDTRFVYRDMLMRFHGSGVGHKSIRNATREFFEDRPSSSKLLALSRNRKVKMHSSLERVMMEGDEGAADGSDDKNDGLDADGGLGPDDGGDDADDDLEGYGDL